LERHEALIDLEANAHDIAEGRQLRQDIRLWREESLDRIRRLDEEHAAKQYKAIMSWLKADEPDQLTIFESISAEGFKHPGTCGWISKTPKVRSWLQNRRETPMLWLQGSPGAGKSVLSAQLINYMKVAKMFVIYHFCTYSYPHSTSYEQILRSLLLQVLRKNGDMVAHVYNECVLEKKSPTLSTLEHLLQVLLTSLSSEPCQTERIWILLDGLDECDTDKQARVMSLLNQVASKSSSSESTICKVLVSSRFTRILAKRLGKKQTLSLGDEKVALAEAIRQYASQRLQSLHHKFSQLDIGTDELREIEHGIARKADGKSYYRAMQEANTANPRRSGMFLYARLVLDYLSTNIFYSGEEVRTSINHLPDKLSDLYAAHYLSYSPTFTHKQAPDSQYG
jgi:DNA-binding Lrp family transcriptional regulator